MLASFLSGECLLHTPYWLHFYLAGFIFMEGISLTHPVLFFFFFFFFFFFKSGEFLLHISCFFIFILFGVFLFRIVCWFLFFIGGASLTHLVLAAYLSGEFLLYIPCWLHFSMGSFSYTSCAGFIFIWRVFLTHSMLFLFAFFSLSLSLFFFLNLGSFSYTSHGCAYHTNCLSKKKERKRRDFSFCGSIFLEK